jgi:hypothetical protein
MRNRRDVVLGAGTNHSGSALDSCGGRPATRQFRCLAGARLELIGLHDPFLVSSPLPLSDSEKESDIGGPQTFIFCRRSSLGRVSTSLAVRMRTELIRGGTPPRFACERKLIRASTPRVHGSVQATSGGGRAAMTFGNRTTATRSAPPLTLRALKGQRT